MDRFYGWRFDAEPGFGILPKVVLKGFIVTGWDLFSTGVVCDRVYWKPNSHRGLNNSARFQVSPELSVENRG